jgi:hypothetical protein
MATVLSGAYHRRNIGDYTEAASAGYDFKLIGQVPYLPWAKIKGTRYHWDNTRISKRLAINTKVGK